MPPAVEAMEAWSLNQQTPKEAPLITSLDLQRLSAAGPMGDTKMNQPSLRFPRRRERKLENCVSSVFS